MDKLSEPVSGAKHSQCFCGFSRKLGRYYFTFAMRYIISTGAGPDELNVIRWFPENSCIFCETCARKVQFSLVVLFVGLTNENNCI